MVGELTSPKNNEFKRRKYTQELLTSMKNDIPAVIRTFEFQLRSECIATSEINSIILNHLDLLYSANLSDHQALVSMKEYIPILKQWADSNLSLDFKSDKLFGKKTSTVGISKIHEIEERFWSPVYGIKGNVDVTASINNQIVPIEVKTGNGTESVAYRAQTALYNLLISDRYGIYY